MRLDPCTLPPSNVKAVHLMFPEVNTREYFSSPWDRQRFLREDTKALNIKEKKKEDKLYHTNV
jgi:hypothetical protein